MHMGHNFMHNSTSGVNFQVSCFNRGLRKGRMPLQSPHILNKPSKAFQFNPDRRYKVGIVPTNLDFKKT